MKKKQMLLGVLSILWIYLQAAGIPLIAESMPALGEVGSFARYGDYAVFTGGEKQLQIMDFSQWSAPRLVSGLDIPGIDQSTRWVSVYQDYAYLFFSSQYAIISLTDPESPQFLSLVQIGQYFVAESISDGVLYLSASEDISYLRSFSLADPMAPQLLDSLQVFVYPENIVCGNDYLICGNNSPEVIRISDPANMLSIGYVTVPNPSGRACTAASGNLYVVACEYRADVYDFSQSPPLLGSVSLNGQNLSNRGYIWGTGFWSDYYQDGNKILGIDLSNPQHPFVSHDGSDSHTGTHSFYMAGNLMARRTNSRSISFASMQTLNEPVFDTGFPLESISSLEIRENRIVGRTQNGLIRILSENPDHSVSPLYDLGAFTMSNFIIHNDLLIFSSRDEYTQAKLLLFNLDTGSLVSELELGYYYLDWSQYLVLDNDLLYICSSDGHLDIIDIHDPLQPVILFQKWDDLNYDCAVVDGGKLWLAADAMIRCYDVRQPSEPAFLYEFMVYTRLTLVQPFRMLKKGEILYTITLSGQLAAIRLAAEGMDSITLLETRYDYLNRIEALGSGIIIGSGEGISVFSLSDPMQPQELTWNDLINGSGSFALLDNRIFLGTGKQVYTFDAALSLLLLENSNPLANKPLITFPNPAADDSKILFDLPSAGKISLQIFNLRGQRLMSRELTNLPQGLNLIPLELKNGAGQALPSGTYLIKLKQADWQLCGKILKL